MTGAPAGLRSGILPATSAVASSAAGAAWALETIAVLRKKSPESEKCIACPTEFPIVRSVDANGLATPVPFSIFCINKLLLKDKTAEHGNGMQRKAATVCQNDRMGDHRLAKTPEFRGFLLCQFGSVVPTQPDKRSVEVVSSVHGQTTGPS